MSLEMVSGEDGTLRLQHGEWDGFGIRFGAPKITCGDGPLFPADVSVEMNERGAREVTYRYPGDLDVMLLIEPVEEGFEIASRIRTPNRGVVFERLDLLDAETGAARFGASPELVRVLTESGYASQVRYLDALEPVASDHALRAREDTEIEPNTETAVEPWDSRGHCVLWDRNARRGLLIGFLTAERWEGTIRFNPGSNGPSLTVGFDGGDTELPGDRTIEIERCCVLSGDDPDELLDRYAELTADAHQLTVQGEPPVSWCSWYPYRLSVSHDRVVQNARVAAERLKPLGMTIIEADLGWESGYLPSSYTENDQFPDGLAATAEAVSRLGFEFGVWKAPYTVSEFDPVAREHPEWLISDGNGAPVAYWTWFWSPHGDVYVLDLTVPEAREYLETHIRGLYDRGVRYFKPDFISCARNPIARQRHDRSVVAGGGLEMARIGAETIRRALADSPILNCGGPDIPGTGSFSLLYACNDTGNTGYIDLDFMRDNYQSLACHLFKNRVWGFLQPSCLCVGLPGTVEEARLRATVAYLTGGQIDVSDDLTTLPEDRWSILTASIPAAPKTARAIDLFDPLPALGSVDYTASCAKTDQDEVSSVSRTAVRGNEIPAGSIWRVSLESDSDSWHLIACFHLDRESIGAFDLPAERIGLTTGESYTAYEFWSGQFLGEISNRRSNPAGTDHPGDTQELLIDTGNASTVGIRFFGPGVKLIAFRRRRKHPWFVGSSFHQSCGLECRSIGWLPAQSKLLIEVDRPVDESGMIVIDPAGRRVESVLVDGEESRWRPGACGSVVIPVTVMSENGVSIETVFKE